MLGEALLLEGGCGVLDLVGASDDPLARMGSGRPTGLPCHLLLETPLLGSGESSQRSGHWGVLGTGVS